VDIYPFFHPANQHFLKLAEDELLRLTELAHKINDELHQTKCDRADAIRLHLSLMLLECKRSHNRQEIILLKGFSENNILVTKFKKLVSQYFLTKKQVAEYADMLAVTPNHLNKVIKESTGISAFENIQAMQLMEAKTLLKHSNQSVSEIAYHLDFSSPGAFNRFFRRSTGITPLQYRRKE
jgi:AraC family transcriptional activator of pobA